ncbi:hypothetical protein AURDEDRAFT_111346 [Auricularia subglabra TFB-10046 SS5]|nr:hypothetical protein AURDEDRAFT_111346 [Auricularia subglabra TFB-10046 SS5]
MSEYWVSKKKYFCKYCEIYIADDAPSRSQHENGLRHQGNKERYVRNLYKTAERKKRDDEEEKREMKRIEAAAQAAYSVDVGAGRGGPSSSSAPAPPPPQERPKPAKMGFSMSNYTTAADLGIIDEDAVKAAAVAAVRQNEGRIGDWEVVASTSSVQPVAMPSHAELDRKRAAPAVDAEDDTRTFEVKKRKIVPGLLGDLYDPVIVKVKRKDEPSEPSLPEEKGVGATAAATAASVADAPRWAPVSWHKASSKTGGEHFDDRGENPDAPPASQEGVEVGGPAVLAPATLSEEAGGAAPQPSTNVDQAQVPKVEEEDTPAASAPAPSMFRKRKGPPTAATRGRRQI